MPLLIAPLPGAVVAFTTRQGGVSDGSFASLNLGFATADAAASVAENRRRALVGRRCGSAPCAEPAPAPRRASWSRRERCPARTSTPRPRGPRAMRWRPRSAGCRSIAHGADCLTAALVGPDGLAVVHAGWRGLVAGVLEAAAERVGPGFSAAVGPGAGVVLLRRGGGRRRRAAGALRRRRRRGRARRPRGLRRPRARARRCGGGRPWPVSARSATPSASTRTAATVPAAAGRPSSRISRRRARDRRARGRA